MLSSYDIRQVSTLVSGVPMGGWSDSDTPLTIEPNADWFSFLVGADGDVMAQANADRTGLATLSLLQSSQSNAFLSALLTAQNSGALSPFPFVVKDLNGSDLVVATQSIIFAPPTMEYGREGRAREWRLGLVGLTVFAGGIDGL